jgi:hypothetical protein
LKLTGRDIGAADLQIVAEQLAITIVPEDAPIPDAHYARRSSGGTVATFASFFGE